MIDEALCFDIVHKSLAVNNELSLSNLNSYNLYTDIRILSSFITNCFINCRKLLIIGNGGSASDSQHFAAELVNRFKIGKFPLPAIALTTDTSILTSIGNDFGYENISSKQVEALGKPGDILFCISTSGKSKNIKKAIDYAKKNDILTLGLTGNNSIDNCILDCYYCIRVNSNDTPRIQEVHILIIHILCEIVEKIMTKYFEEN